MQAFTNLYFFFFHFLFSADTRNAKFFHFNACMYKFYLNFIKILSCMHCIYRHTHACMHVCMRLKKSQKFVNTFFRTFMHSCIHTHMRVRICKNKMYKKGEKRTKREEKKTTLEPVIHLYTKSLCVCMMASCMAYTQNAYYIDDIRMIMQIICTTSLYIHILWAWNISSSAVTLCNKNNNNNMFGLANVKTSRFQGFCNCHILRVVSRNRLECSLFNSFFIIHAAYVIRTCHCNFLCK